MAGYIGTKAVNLSTTGADINGNANVDGTLDVTGATTVTGAFTSLGIDDNAAATAVTIDASGNVGIDTAVPAEKFSMQGGTLRLEKQVADVSVNDVVGTIMASPRSYAPAGAGMANIKFIADATTWHKGIIAFSTNNVDGTDPANPPVERMRIDASGNVLVGTTSSLSFGTGTAQGVTIEPSALVASRSAQAPLFLQRSGSDGRIVEFYRDTALVGDIGVNGSSTGYNTSSDYRLKENITPVQGAADIVKMMRPCTYTFKSDGSWHDGFLAHELQELHPRAVTGSKDAMRDEEYEVTPAVLDDDGNVVTEAVMGTRSVPDYQGIDQSKLVPLLVATIQELEARIAALESN